MYTSLILLELSHLANCLQIFKTIDIKKDSYQISPIQQTSYMSKKSLQILTLRQVPTVSQAIQSLKNLQKIVPINIASTQFKSSLKQYGEEQMILYKLNTASEGQQKFITFLKQQRVGDAYINQLNGQIFSIEPLENKIIDRKLSQNAKIDGQKKKSIQLLHEMLEKYLNDHYVRPYAVACHFKLTNNSLDQVIIGLTSKNTNFENYYSGQWTSYWSIKPSSFEAKINVRNHFFQNGNVLFKRQKPIKMSLSNENLIDFNNLDQKQVQKIVKIVASEQQCYKKELQRIFTQNLTKSFKKLRRVSPLTQGKMIWNVNAVLLSQGLGQKNELKE